MASPYIAVLNVGGAMLIEMIIGFVCGKFGFITQKSVQKLNKFVFKATLLPQMCRAFAQKNLYAMNFTPLAGCALMSLSTQILLAIVVNILYWKKDSFEIFLGIQLPVIYLNYVIIGVPLFNSIWGEENNAITGVIIMSNDLIIIPIYQALTSIYKMKKAKLEVADGDGDRESDVKGFTWYDVLTIILNIFKSPLIQGIILGIIWSLTTLELPIYLDRVLSTLQACVVGCALFCVGGLLSTFSLLGCTWGEFLLGMFFRFIIMPLFSCVYSYAIGLTGTETRQCLVMCLVTSSSACSSISLAANVKPGVSTTLILWSTIFFIPFIMAWLSVLDALNLFL